MYASLQSAYTDLDSFIGRLELLHFLALYALTLPLQLLTTGAFLEQGSTALTALSAVHAGLVAATFWALLGNAIISTQVLEDGTISALIVSTAFYLSFLLFFALPLYTAPSVSSHCLPSLSVLVHQLGHAMWLVGTTRNGKCAALSPQGSFRLSVLHWRGFMPRQTFKTSAMRSTAVPAGRSRSQKPPLVLVRAARRRDH